MADAGFRVGLGLDQAQEPESCWVGDRPEGGGEADRRRAPPVVLASSGAQQEAMVAMGLHCGDHIDTRSMSSCKIAGNRRCVDAEEEERCREVLDRSRSITSTRRPRLWRSSSRASSRGETIARYIAESLDLLGGARVNVYVPVLAHRFARERLKALAQAEGMIVKEQPEVLFVCVHNAGRSQMAAGLVKLRSEGECTCGRQGATPATRSTRPWSRR